MRYVIKDLLTTDRLRMYVTHDAQQSSHLQWDCLCHAKRFGTRMAAQDRIDKSKWYMLPARRADLQVIPDPTEQIERSSTMVTKTYLEKVAATLGGHLPEVAVLAAKLGGAHVLMEAVRFLMATRFLLPDQSITPKQPETTEPVPAVETQAEDAAAPVAEPQPETAERNTDSSGQESDGKRVVADASKAPAADPTQHAEGKRHRSTDAEVTARKNAIMTTIMTIGGPASWYSKTDLERRLGSDIESRTLTALVEEGLLIRKGAKRWTLYCAGSRPEKDTTEDGE